MPTSHTTGKNVATRTTQSPSQGARRRRERAWAKAWKNGDAHCPQCAGTDFALIDSPSQDQTRFEVYRCKAPKCGARWKLEFREAAIAVLPEDATSYLNWIELARFADPSDPYRLSERATATIIASLRFWQREGVVRAGYEQELASADGELNPLSPEEIDELCELLN